MFTSMNSFIMVAVPLFILSGYLLDEGGVAEKIYNFANAMMGWMHGGLGNVAIFLVCFCWNVRFFHSRRS